MANNKKIVNQIEYKFSIEGLDREIKRLENLNVVEGEAGKKIRYIITGYKNLKDIITAYGDNIPVDKLKEMSNIFEKLKKVLNSLSTETELGGIKTEAKDFTKELKELQNQLEEIEKLKQKPAKKVVDAKAMALAEIDKNEILKAAIQKRGNPLNSLKAKVNAGNKENATEQDKIIGLEAQKAIKALQEQKEALRKEEIKEQKEYNELLEKEKRIRQEIAQYIKQQKKAEGQGPAIDPGQLAVAKKYIIEQEAATRRAREEAEKTGASVVKISTGVDKVAGSIQNATGRVLKFTLVYQTLKKILKESVKTIEEMDESLTGMMVVTGKTREEVESYITAIKDVSAATSTAMTDVANLVTEYVRQGRTMKEALLLAEETAKAAKIAGISTRDSIIYMTSAINGFNLAVKDATRVSDIFANLAAVSATNYEQLAIALSKVSAQANMAGMSIEYTTALLAKGIETTQEAPESIGTALKTIIARMRELTDYGKTLEEGTSVNRVESALRSAGIELRTVNGEFRNLEDVFNELGPKWDSLNNNQRQAIAQAVAGTRQQSRFVAIMQDWTRTQELATEAQDSAAASAAQYAQYATGIEAAFTRLKTAWQGFMQSITSSKVIIGAFNLLAKIINGITTVLEGMGGLAKPLFIIISGVLILRNLFDKIKNIMLSFNTDDRAAKEREMIILTQQHKKEAAELLLKQQALAEEKGRGLKEEEKKLKEEKKKLEEEKKKIDEAIKAEKARIEQEMEENSTRSALGMKEAEFESSLPGLEAELASINAAIKEKDLERKAVSESRKAVEKEIKDLTDERKTLLNDINENEEEYQAAVGDSVSSVHALNSEYIRRLELKRSLLDAEIQLLETRKSEALAKGDLASAAGIEKQLLSLANKRERLTKNINKLEGKNKKLLEGTASVYEKIGSVLSAKIGMAIDGIASKFGVIGELIGGILKQMVVWSLRSLGELGTQIFMTREKRKQQRIEIVTAAVKAGVITEEAGRLLLEKLLTREKKKQNKEEKVGFFASIARTVSALTELGIIKLKTKAKQKENAVDEKGAILGAAKGASSVPMVGWIIALALLALAGVAGIAAISASASDGRLAKSKQIKQEGEIGKAQTTIYDREKESKDLQKSQKRYNELAQKSIKTEEEKEEMSSLIESMKQANEEWENLSDDRLLEEVNKRIIENNLQIDALIESNYKAALEMKNLSQSVVGQRAIVDKLIKEQDKLIKTNTKLIELNDPRIAENVAAASASVIDKVVANYDYSKLEAAEKADIKWYHYLIDSYAFLKDRENEKEQAKERAKVVRDLEEANKKVVQAITDIETELIKEDTNIVDQVKAYEKALKDTGITNELGEVLNQVAKDALDSQYATISFISSVTQGNAQVLDNIKKLTDFGNVTTENIVKLAEVFSSLDERQKKGQKVLGFLNAIKDLDIGKHSTWDDLKETFVGRTSGVTFNEFLTAMMGIVKKDDDDNYKKDGKGNYRIPSGYGLNNEEFTNIVKLINSFVAEGFGDYSFELIEKLGQAAFQASPTDMFADFINAIGGAVKEGMTVDERQQAWESASVKAFESTDDWIAKQQALSSALIDEAKNLRDKALDTTDPDERDRLLGEASALQNDAFILNQEISKFRTQLDDAFRVMRGDLTSTELWDRVTAGESSKKMIEEIKEAALSTGEFTREQYAALDDVIIKMQEEGKIKDPAEFLKNLKEGAAEAIDILNEYSDLITTKTLEKLNDNVWTKEQAVEKAQDRLDNAKTESEIKEAQAAFFEAKRALAEAVSLRDDFEKSLDRQDELLRRQHKLSVLQMRLERTNNENILDTVKERKNILEEMEGLYNAQLEEEYDKQSRLVGISQERLEAYVKMVRTGEKMEDMEWLEELDKEAIEALNGALDTIMGIEKELEDIAKTREEDAKNWYETQIDYQNQIVNAYKSQLEKERDLLKESLDKRKTLYQKYFDFLDQEDEETDFESERKRLQDTIAKLSTASDAGSLARLKEAQEELAELEKDRLKTERQQRRDAIETGIEAKSKAIDDEFERITSNAQEMWETVSQMSSEQIESLMTTYNKEFQNATDLNKEYLLLSYTELMANVKRMAGDIEGAEKLDQRAEAIRNLQIARSSGDAKAIAAAEEVLNALPYEEGGKVTHTGLAMVHGSPSKPEAFLNATQTMLLSNLGTNLQKMAIIMRSGGAISTDINRSTLSIEDFTININANMTNDQNIQKTGETLAEIFFERIQASGIPINRKR